MLKKILLSAFVVFFALYGCSINISQPSTGTSVPQTNTNASAGNNAGTQALNGKSVPVTWDGLNITGKLVYNAAVIHNGQLLVNIQVLDLTTGQVTTVYQTPNGAWIDAVAVSPDDKQLIISYTPASGGQNTLYRLPIDGSQPPQLLFAPASADDRYFQPEWSPDGKYIYFVQYNYQTTTIYTLMRMAYPGGVLETLANNAYWPRTSGDGSLIVYVSPAYGVNTLYVANPDGSGAHQISLSGSYIPNVIDSPMFLADGQSILFSAPVIGLSSAPSLADRLFGVIDASADGSIPSDWWSVPLTGGVPKRLTHLRSMGLFARFSPDKNHIASYSASGIFIMNPDGTGVTQILNYTGGTQGTVNWIP